MNATFIEYVVFFSAAVMILGGAIGVIAMKSPVHAALGLVLTLFGVAVQFVALGAHFVAVVQIIVYAGAIVVLFLFVIMLLGIDRTMDLQVEPIPLQRPLALVMGVGLVGLLGAAIVRARDSLAINPGDRPRRRRRERRSRCQHPTARREPVRRLRVRPRTGIGAADRGRDRHGARDAALATVGRPRRRRARRVGPVIAVIEPTWYLLLSALLFSIGAVGLLIRRNPLVMVMCIELMLNAANLSFVALSVQLGNIDGQTAVFFVMVVAAAEAVVGLGILVSILRARPGATADDLAELKG